MSELSAVKAGMSRLPSNLAGLKAAEAMPWSNGVTYKLACACGSEFLRLEATPAGDGGYLDPVSATCDSCGASAKIFDSARDGYDGRLNGGACYDQGSDASPVACPSCGETRSIVHCDLAYNCDFEEEGDLESLAIAPDLFDWISISTSCPNGHAAQELGSWEMA